MHGRYVLGGHCYKYSSKCVSDCITSINKMIPREYMFVFQTKPRKMVDGNCFHIK